MCAKTVSYGRSGYALGMGEFWSPRMGEGGVMAARKGVFQGYKNSPPLQEPREMSNGW